MSRVWTNWRVSKEQVYSEEILTNHMYEEGPKELRKFNLKKTFRAVIIAISKYSDKRD